MYDRQCQAVMMEFPTLVTSMETIALICNSISDAYVKETVVGILESKGGMMYLNSNLASSIVI